MHEVALMARLYKAWTLTEIKTLAVRERRYWLDVGLWNLTT